MGALSAKAKTEFDKLGVEINRLQNEKDGKIDDLQVNYDKQITKHLRRRDELLGRS